MASVVPPCPFTKLHPVTLLLLDKNTSNDEPGLVRALAHIRAEARRQADAEAEARRQAEDAELLQSYVLVTNEDASNAEEYTALWQILSAHSSVLHHSVQEFLEEKQPRVEPSTFYKVKNTLSNFGRLLTRG